MEWDGIGPIPIEVYLQGSYGSRARLLNLRRDVKYYLNIKLAVADARQSSPADFVSISAVGLKFNDHDWTEKFLKLFMESE